jgi:N-acetylglucosamine kinase-like BadF-type ATPase
MTGGGEYVAELLQGEARIRRLRVEPDTVTAHAGALLGKAGVIVIAGTGSAAYGLNAQGKTAHAGGWAYLMGDEGSGYDIGRQALVAAARVEDGRGPDTCLFADIVSHFMKRDLWEVRALVYSRKFDRLQVAALAPLVARAAGLGDRIAQSILDGAGLSLAELAAAVIRRLGLEEERTHVAPVGGVFRAGEMILQPFERALKVLSPRAFLAQPILPPVLGAALLALKQAGISIDDDIETHLREAAGKLEEK